MVAPANNYEVVSPNPNFVPLENPMTDVGDIIVGGTDGAPERLGIGTALQIARVNAGETSPEYVSVAEALNGLSTTAGAVIWNNDGTWEALAPGAVGQRLKVTATDTLAYANLASSGAGAPAAADQTNLGEWYYSTGFGAAFVSLQTGVGTYAQFVANVTDGSSGNIGVIRSGLLAGVDNALGASAGFQTTDATPVEAGRVYVPAGQSRAVIITVKGILDDNSVGVAWTIAGLALNTAGVISIIGTPVRGGTAQPAGKTWDVNLDNSGSANHCGVFVKGQVGDTVNWKISCVQLA